MYIYNIVLRITKSIYSNYQRHKVKLTLLIKEAEKNGNTNPPLELNSPLQNLTCTLEYGYFDMPS